MYVFAPVGSNILQSFQVSFRYPVHFTRGAFRRDNPALNKVLRGAGKVLSVLDAGAVRRHPRLPAFFHKLGPILVLPGGERVKNDRRHWERLVAAIHRARLDRHSFVIAVGGGALLDAAGFAAATAHRGIRLVRVPTTVLSQCDSGVGVKNGINAFRKKNFLGVFAPPYAVINDADFLSTLSDRDWRAGLVEAVKVALVKDAAFFGQLEKLADRLARRDLNAMASVVHRCAALHLRHIATGGDPFESGSSRPLDFGHWAAHKLEQMSDFQLRHGEAVSIGIVLDCAYAVSIGILSRAHFERIVGLLRRLRLPVFSPLLLKSALLGGLDEFREHLGGELTILLLRGIGRPVEVHQVERRKMAGAVRVLAALS